MTPSTFTMLVVWSPWGIIQQLAIAAPHPLPNLKKECPH